MAKLSVLIGCVMLWCGTALADTSFDHEAVVTGVTGDRATCPDAPGHLWVVVHGEGDCIRYYGSMLDVGAQTVFVSIHGDLPVTGENAKTRLPRLYRKWDSPAKMAARADGQRAEAGIDGPFVFVARPGLFGSTGFHTERRGQREVDLMNRALDLLKQRYGITQFHLSGQSGGGHIVASVLPLRRDVGCAVTSAGIVSVAQRAMIQTGTRDIAGGHPYHDPVDHVDGLPGAPLRLLVIADPEDAVSPFAAQEHYVGAAQKAGADVSLLTAKGTGARRHSLGTAGRVAMRLCAEGASVPEIQSGIHRLTGMPG
ncbi:hypothetical protein [uncultured Tateyamaria sp.]|uniref:hypothetical protein n=1 Tax=Tateyamaria sp. 1078 TaxID=3417464 RepID=UPI0026055AD9|nr:hypothetical protein [uncultured Tateyamaria sp.]